MGSIRIDRRFRGPPDSGNGGYVAGMLARELGASGVSVTLRLPPPLDRDLELGSDATTAWLRDGEALVGTAVRHDLSIDVPAPPTVAAARLAEARYAGLRHHNFPGCFVCGPDRIPGDGLRLFPGALADGRGQVASTWAPDSSLLDCDGFVRSEFMWAALDCPGYWAVAGNAGVAVLGKFEVELYADSVLPQPLIVTGWPIASEGRKHRAGTALQDRGGRLLAAAEAIWVTLRD